MNRIISILFINVLILNTLNLRAQDDISDLIARGKDLYFERVSCWVCHGDEAGGGVGPSLQHGPSPMDIQEQLDSNPQMEVIVVELKPDADDLIALATYIHDLNDKSVDSAMIASWSAELEAMQAARAPATEYFLTARDQKVLDIQSFDSVMEDWQRRAKTGSLKKDYQVRVLATYDAGEPVFRPEPGKLYFYQNTGTNARRARDIPEPATSTQVVVGDAVTKEVIASSQMPDQLRGAVHTTVLSPDGRYVYIIGPSSQAPAQGMGQGMDQAMGQGMGMGGSVLRTPATMLKVDALTLQPIKQMAVGGRLHHAQVFRDRYLLIDTFVSDPDGLDVFLFDPETDQITGGVDNVDLGGLNYTAYTDDEFIYILMQPGGDVGLGGASLVATGQMTALRPYWVAKLDPDTWEVVAEFPYRGYRGDWIVIDSKSEYLYIPAAGSSSVSKIDNMTGENVWSAATGTGPYGGDLNMDESELWIANKGEGTGFIGRTLTVIDTASGRPMDTLFAGYGIDHVLLAPNGKEMWATSNAEGRIYTFDAETHEQIKVIDMPGRGDPHGLVWVKYDENGKGRVVRDQGGFHHGIYPARGKPLIN